MIAPLSYQFLFFTSLHLFYRIFTLHRLFFRGEFLIICQHNWSSRFRVFRAFSIIVVFQAFFQIVGPASIICAIFAF